MKRYLLIVSLTLIATGMFWGCNREITAPDSRMRDWDTRSPIPIDTVKVEPVGETEPQH